MSAGSKAILGTHAPNSPFSFPILEKGFYFHDFYENDYWSSNVLCHLIYRKMNGVLV